MHWFPVALFSAITLAAADVLIRKYFRDYHGWELVMVRFIVPGLLLVPFAVINPIPVVPPVFWGWMALLVPLELFAMLLYMIAIRDSPLYLTLPYLAFTPVFSALGGYLILGEVVSLQGLAGILCVVAGAYMINLNHFRLRTLGGWFAPLGAVLDERGSRLMLIAAMVYSLTSVLSKHVMGYATPSSFGAFYFASIAGVLLIATLFYRPSSLVIMTQRLWPLLLVGVLMALMVVAHFLAIALVEVAYFISVKRSSLLFAIVLGVWWLGERFAPRHLFAGSLMVAGVALILG